MLHSERFVDVAPEETYARLLDEGTYLCSTRTMYRILAARHGGVRDRRDQLTHPLLAKPELLAERQRASVSSGSSGNSRRGSSSASGSRASRATPAQRPPEWCTAR